MVRATTIWLHALTTCPAPMGPTCVATFPITSNSGRARSKSSSEPPTMMESAPSMAPTSPPETGASSIEAPFSRTFSESSSVTTGEIVLMSTSSAPSLIPSRTPSSPATTASTSGESGSMVMTTSHASATSLGLPAAVALPSSASSSAFSGLRLWTTSS